VLNKTITLITTGTYKETKAATFIPVLYIKQPVMSPDSFKDKTHDIFKIEEYPKPAFK